MRKVIKCSTRIEAGVLQKIKEKLKKLGTKVNKFILGLPNIGIEVISSKVNDAEGVDLKLRINENEANVTLNPTDTENVVNVIIKDKNGSIKTEVDNVDEDKVESLLLDNFDKLFGYNEDVEACAYINCTLSKTKTKSGYNIDLHKISASLNVNPEVNVECLNDLCANTQFCNELTETPSSYSLECYDDHIDCFECDGVDEVDTTESIILHLVHFHNVMSFAHWNIKGSNFFELHGVLENYKAQSGLELDEFMELYAEAHPGKCTPYPYDIYECPFTDNDFEDCDQNRIMKVVQEELRNHVDILELYYCNYPSDVQSRLDDMIRYWSKEANYKLDHTICD